MRCRTILSSTLRRVLPCLAIIACLSSAPFGAPRAQVPPAHASGGEVTVPLDHRSPAGPSASLRYELGAAFDAAKPTVFVIADAQQFYVRAGAMPALQASLFGDGFNVVGILGRATGRSFVRASQDAGGRTDWRAAWRVFNSAQWVEDIEAVRRHLLGEHGKVLLYGRSGGAFLIHQYLAVHGDHVERAWTQTPLNPYIAAGLGLRTDHFWDEIGAYDPGLQTLLRQALARAPGERARWLRILQRQNFFVPLARRDEERARLIRAMAADDTAMIEAAGKAYQVDEVARMMAAPEGVAILVRLYEFEAPFIDRARPRDDGIHPGEETFRDAVRPLRLLAEQGLITPVRFDSARLHRLDTEVLVLAGRHDHTADYRALIALSAHYPHGLLFIADDTHVFEAMNRQGHATGMLRAFLTHGADSAAYRAAESAADALRWRE
ncbi:hypothetical protein [Pseudoxanthomonas sp. z9]|uniref:hypothetical protein n=1 Tax=Pseudoxanthomonas sp. z9 TaxID=2584942 RepID=UPI0015E88893|nr:hypothetical protein [Pseudoxanthomonas sp. z9]